MLRVLADAMQIFVLIHIEMLVCHLGRLCYLNVSAKVSRAAIDRSNRLNNASDRCPAWLSPPLQAISEPNSRDKDVMTNQVESLELDQNDAVLPERYRAALRGVGATVTVITTAEGDERHCMVATAMTSVSLEPPVLMIAVNQSASVHPAIQRRGAFAVNVLSAEHASLGKAIAKAARQDRFGVGLWRNSKHPDTVGIPYLEDIQSVIFCKLIQAVEHGTHTLFIGEVVDVLASETHNTRDPLLYCDGAYGRFTPIA